MSDYMFMLESHLSADQSRAVSEIQSAATHANLNVFLTGGAMRDMLGGFPIVEIDFTIEGNALKVAQAVAKKTGAKIQAEDDNRKVANLVFRSGVHASAGMAPQGENTQAWNQTRGSAGHDSRGFARARLHHQFHRAVAESGIAWPTAGS